MLVINLFYSSPIADVVMFYVSSSNEHSFLHLFIYLFILSDIKPQKLAVYYFLYYVKKRKKNSISCLMIFGHRQIELLVK